MYAIIAESGRQYKVSEGEELDIDYRDLSAGDKLTFDNVLACGGDGELKLGEPKLEGASVSAEVVGITMGDKLVVQKFRRRKNSRRKNGHRQMFLRVKINKIAAK